MYFDVFYHTEREPKKYKKSQKFEAVATTTATEADGTADSNLELTASDALPDEGSSSKRGVGGGSRKRKSVLGGEEMYDFSYKEAEVS
jgi:hypothetical protein